MIIMIGYDFKENCTLIVLIEYDGYDLKNEAL
jgi:hypothetical protein